MDSIIQRFQDSPLGAVDFLHQHSAVTPEQCCEVIEFELASKAAVGQPFQIETYVVGCPIVADSEDSLLRLILAEHRLRPTSLGEVSQRFPQLSDAVRKRLEQAVGTVVTTESQEQAGETIAVPPTPSANRRSPHQPKHSPAELVTREFTGGSAGSQASVPPRASSVPELIASDYQIEEMIAQGGMGVVYRAHQVSLNRDVALKMIRSAALASEAEIRRFQVEAEAAAKLNHPGIVPIYEVGESNDCPYFSMELLDGGSLEQMTGPAKLPPREAVSLLANVADAVHFGHERGIIHRDLKPSNILLDAGGRPKVADFGLAKDLGRDQGMTASGTLLGTPSYMAPEQALGKLEDVGPRADVYALGAILYFLLTEQPPFLGEGFLETIQQVIEHTPVSPDRMAAGVDRDLSTICMKCLEKRPKDRYGSAADLAADLRRWRDDLPIVARKPSTFNRLRKWVRRHAALSGLTAVLALVLIIASISVTLSWWKTRSAEQSLAEQSNQLEKAQGELATEIVKGQRLKEVERVRAEQDLRNAYATKVRELNVAWAAADLKKMRQLLDETGQGEMANLRGVEWHIQDYRAHADLLTLNFRSPCRQVAINRDGNRVVGLTSNVSLWDAVSGKRISEWAVPMSCAAFDAEGQLVAMGEKLSKGSRLRICSAVDGSEQVHADIGEEPIDCIGFAGARVVLATGAKLILCDRDGSQAVNLTGHTGRITDLAIHATGGIAVTTSDDNSVRVWDLQHGVELRRLENAAAVECLDLHADGVLLAGGQANTLSLWNVQTGEKLKSLPRQEGRIHDVCFGAPSQRLLFSANEQNVIQAWSLNTESVVATFKGHERAVLALGASGPTGLIASGSMDGTVKIWSERLPERRRQLAHSNAVATSVDFNSRGDMLVRGFDSGEVHAVSVPDAQTIRHIPATAGAIHELRFSPTDNTLAIATDAATLLCPMDEQTPQPQVIGAGAVSVDFDMQGKLLASAGRDGVVRIHRLDSGALLNSLPKQDEVPTDVDLLPDGRRVLVASQSGITLWEVATGDLLWSLDTEKHTADLEVRRDGKQFAVARYDGRIKLFDLQQQPKEPMRVLVGHAQGVTAVRYSQDGRRLATASDDLTVRIWQVEDGVELLALADHPASSVDVALHPGNRYLASVSLGGLDFLFGPECRGGDTVVDGRARQRLTLLIDRDPEPAAYYRLRALARRAAGDLAGANDDMQEYENRLTGGALPQNAAPMDAASRSTVAAQQELLFNRGTQAAERGDYAGALAAYREAFGLAVVEDGWKHTEYAVLLRNAGEERAYQELCRSFQRRHANSAYVGRLFMLGEHQQAALEAATLSAEEALLADIQPWNQFLLGVVHYRAGRFSRAEEFIRISMQSHEYLVFRWLYLSMTLAQRKRLAEAREFFEKADRWLNLAKSGTPPDEGNGANLQTWSHRLELELLRAEAAKLLE